MKLYLRLHENKFCVLKYSPCVRGGPVSDTAVTTGRPRGFFRCRAVRAFPLDYSDTRNVFSRYLRIRSRHEFYCVDIHLYTIEKKKIETVEKIIKGLSLRVVLFKI